eukprot:1451952-Amphidinium_carterae.5
MIRKMLVTKKETLQWKPRIWEEQGEGRQPHEEPKKKVLRTEKQKDELTLRLAPGFMLRAVKMSAPPRETMFGRAQLCLLPEDHECWNIWPKKYNGLPNTFATHSEMTGFNQKGSTINEAQHNYEKVRHRPIITTDQPYPISGLLGFPTLRQVCGMYDTQGRWIPRLPAELICAHIQKYSIHETLSWMLGNMDDLVILKDKQNEPLNMEFGIEESRPMFDLRDPT